MGQEESRSVVASSVAAERVRWRAAAEQRQLGPGGRCPPPPRTEKGPARQRQAAQTQAQKGGVQLPQGVHRPIQTPCAFSSCVSARLGRRERPLGLRQLLGVHDHVMETCLVSLPRWSDQSGPDGRLNSQNCFGGRAGVLQQGKVTSEHWFKSQLF